MASLLLLLVLLLSAIHSSSADWRSVKNSSLNTLDSVSIFSNRTSGNSSYTIKYCFCGYTGSQRCFDLDTAYSDNYASYSRFCRSYRSGGFLDDIDVARCSKRSRNYPPFYFYFLAIGVCMVLIFIPVIFMFNLNLASGPGYSFVFFYQCAPMAFVLAGQFTTFLVMQDGAHSYFARNSPDAIIFQYLKHIIVVFVAVVLVILVQCTWCPVRSCLLPWAKLKRAVRNFREKHVGNTFIHGLCSLVVLSYGDLMGISVKMVVQFAFCSPTMSINTFLYLILPLIIIGILLILPLSLIYYPTIPALFHKLTNKSLPRFIKLDPVFDVFQGVYKDRMRWFAGVHLLYIGILWVAYILYPDSTHFLFIIVLAIQGMLRPFKCARHNYLENLYLLYLVLMSSGNIFVMRVKSAYATPGSVSPSQAEKDVYAAALSIAFTCLVLPTFLVIVYISYKILLKCKCCAACVSKVKRIKKLWADKSMDSEAATDLVVEVKQKDDQNHCYYEAEWL